MANFYANYAASPNGGGITTTTVTTIGTIDSTTASSNGAAIVGHNLIMQSASVTRPGLVNNSAQSMSGAKTFTTSVETPQLLLKGSVSGDLTHTVPSAVTPYSLQWPAAQAGGATFLKNDGSGGLSWASGTGASGVDSIGTINSQTKSADGALIVGTTMYFQTTDATNPGMVSNGAQTLGSGTKTVDNLIDSGLTINTAVIANGSKQLASSATTSTELGYVSGVTSAIQTQLNSKGSGTVTAVSVASANGLAGSSSGGATPALTLSTTVTGVLQGNGTAISAATTTGSGSVVLATAPTLSNPVVGTQSQGDSSTKAASTSYVDVAVANAVAGINPAVAVQAATTAAADTSGFTYNNGVSGVGATFTGSVNTAITIDGYTFTAVGQRLLVKNDTQSPSGAFNGVYYVTQVQTGILAPILTRALDYNTPNDMNNTGAIPVINGTVNGTTSWVQTSLIVTVGTTPLVFVEFTRNPADYLLKANNLSDVAVKATSFNNLSPMSASGDIIYGGASGAGTRLAKGSDGQVLTLASGLPSWAAAVAGNPWTNSATINSNTVMVTANRYFVDTTGGAVTMTMPTGPSNGDYVEIVDIGGAASTNAITVGRASQSIQGLASNYLLESNFGAWAFSFKTTSGWYLV